jgi:hypothetical protein
MPLVSPYDEHGCDHCAGDIEETSDEAPGARLDHDELDTIGLHPRVPAVGLLPHLKSMRFPGMPSRHAVNSWSRFHRAIIGTSSARMIANPTLLPVMMMARPLGPSTSIIPALPTLPFDGGMTWQCLVILLVQRPEDFGTAATATLS